ncbi:MAG: TetR/AcrR family transcriptional regulator [Hyphomonadaceae bacterium]
MTAAPRRTQLQRRIDAETKLLDASLTLLVERGYDRFALSEVGELAGYSRGLAAHHFVNKEGLLEALTQYIVGGFAKGIKRQPAVAPGWDTIVRNIRYYTSSPTRNPRLFRAYMIILAEAALRPRLGALAEQTHQRAVQSLMEDVEAGKAAGNILPEIDAKRSAETIYAFQRGLHSLAMLDKDLDTGAIAETFISAMQLQMCPPGQKRKGRSD